ncbi:hypothetical protein CHS0354_028342 [Potamilus streckersoni]|uniref:Uncharacterized protein n=1 Tax=Potamilus streckersoni TaxID=2493646 RepID=A0AAE0RU00_9BIVA|nr:hypothetical protein CHS0354_028342 [Potamilus streckersoni]
MASGKSFVSVLIAVIFLTETCFSVAFPVEDYAEKKNPKTEAKFFECHVMACLIGTQFCNAFWKRCDDCLLYEKDCFTSRQQPNCTVFCQEKWLMKQRKILKSEKCKTGEGQYASLPWIVATAVLAVLLLAFGCILFRDKIRSSVRWLGLKLSKCGGKYDAESKRVHIRDPERDTFLVQDKRLTEKQQRTCTKPSIEGTKQAQPSDVYRTLDPNSIFSDRTNKKNASLPRPETDSEN